MRRLERETRAAWGEAQAAKYSTELRNAIKSLLDYPLRFPEFEPRPGLRRMTSGKHAVFYLVLENRIEIIRVMHLASDFERWL